MSGFWNTSATLPKPSIRRIRTECRPRASNKYGTKGLGWPDDFDTDNLDTAEFYYRAWTLGVTRYFH